MPSLKLPPHRQTPSLVSSPFHPAGLPKPATIEQLPSNAFFDLVLIGAGPAALAVLSRILETRPAALYTEEEHRYLHWLRQKSGKTSSSVKQRGAGTRHALRVIKTQASGRGAERVIVGEKSLSGDGGGASNPNEECECEGEMKILVIDRVGDGFMANWDRLFAALDIKHLRSPLFFHPCPADLDSLLAFAQRSGRTKVADGNYVASPANAPGCAHSGHTGKTTRGRDRRVKRLGCCANLDEDDGSPSPSSALDEEPDLVEIPGVVGAERSKHKKCRQRIDPKKYGRIVGASGGAVNERERKDYFTPSTKLFKSFIREDLMTRYGISTQGAWPAAKEALQSLDDDQRSTTTTVKGEVTSMHWSQLHVQGWEPAEGFYLETTDGARIGAKAVVSAVGPAGKPSIPPALLNSTQQLPSNKPEEAASESTKPPPSLAPLGPQLSGPGWCHSAALARADACFPPRFLSTKSTFEPKTLVVVGGGLTSAQICDVALRKGFTKVKLLLRGHMKVKPFDIGLDWMGRYSNLRKMQFWQEDDPATRLAMIKDARQGGSMTLPYAKLMKRYEELGALEILTHTEIGDAKWDQDAHKWSLRLDCKAPTDPRAEAKQAYEDARKVDDCDTDDVDGQDREEEQQPTAPASSGAKQCISRDVEADYIVTASAFVPNFATLPFMEHVVSQYPVHHEGGFPLVTEDLQYGNLPLFVVGLYAGLQVSPSSCCCSSR